MRLRLRGQKVEATAASPSREELERIRGVVFVDGEGAALWPPIRLNPLVVPEGANEVRLTMDFEMEVDS